MSDAPICSIWIAPRIWFDEVERIGMQRCTPFGYVLNWLGGLFWLLGILAIFVMPVYLVYRGFAGTFSWWLLWLLALPFVIVFIGALLIGASWTLAYCKNFYYDYEHRESNWVEGGEKRSYTLSDWQAGQRQKNGGT